MKNTTERGYLLVGMIGACLSVLVAGYVIAHIIAWIVSVFE